MADPTRPEIVGRWWLPGMNTAAGETSAAPEGKRYALHHALVSGDTAYACWRDGGLTLLDISDHSTPKLITHRNWSPPYGGGTHSPLPCPVAGSSLLPTRRSSTMKRTGASTPGSSTSASPRTRSASRPSPSLTRPTTLPRAATSGRTTCTKTARLVRLRDADLRHLAECRHPGLRHLRSLPPARNRRAGARRPENHDRQAPRPTTGHPIR
jgi:hypothetical protein